MEIVPVEWNGKEVINPPRSWIEGILTAVSQIFEMGRDRDDRSSNNFFHQDSSYLRSIGKKGNYISFHDLRCIRVVSMLTTMTIFRDFSLTKLDFSLPSPFFPKNTKEFSNVFFSRISLCNSTPKSPLLRSMFRIPLCVFFAVHFSSRIEKIGSLTIFDRTNR